MSSLRRFRKIQHKFNPPPITPQDVYIGKASHSVKGWTAAGVHYNDAA